ncbi:potassium-transporting ATPase subunit KdpA [Stenotrophomonas maltophilia]|uniref:potassium-transporting ATPase subunit KdpA n=1 Tax=Stenotrophomonas TaxID=40323 RepID=UPI000C16247E|nr:MULTISPECIES: potassium-transporting ATPase subunit KdpA [Stenotrophomonas]EMB2830434.1 potassium-transporting ATPase subunit KdpA [Stenotrophomonas maltophilia]MBH1386809.1 potassium-transporting ATPase subunit KdpA [Stenotrophomonas maltophilia]MBH1452175.1 potassium-transporting ATPase subunit KdpA [Stenotrophomonas maltophilia]MBH1730085.1 potassium-transporting ATPase subunit KdpA [Stenotrophomonas maltophilia]MBK5594818.1 potassium-transporting ATPase subunit KdpA [Stenotrophomonas ma
MTEMLVIIAASLLLAWPLGLYLARVMRGTPMKVDVLFHWIEKPLYKVLGVDPSRAMSWRGYVLAFVLSNVVVAVLTQAVFMTQAWLPLNPDQIPNMRWDTALHTMISFLTNTNQQHYSGQAQLSYFSQMTGITGLQVVTPMMGLALAVATLRALFSRAPQAAAATGSGDDRQVAVGNYYVDVVRLCVRFLLPLCLVWTLVLTSQGVPSTMAGGPQATPIDASAGMAEQKLPLGPVAAMVAAKQLGANGGGWYGPNSSFPLENPTPLSNALEIVGILLVPMAVIFMIGAFTGRRRFGALVFSCMLGMSLLSTGAMMWSEGHSASAATPLLMEGKEVRFGADGTALWAAVTTQVSNGSVNGMHDSLAPLSGGIAMVNMLVSAIWGGIGCGLQQFIVYLLLGVFLAGLMTGRTPELFGRKLETPQVRLLALLVLLQPITLLVFTAITLAVPGLAGTSNPGFHGISQVFYEYVSAYANNGSGFEGLGDATLWWNLSCSLVLLLGRFPLLIIPLVVAAQLAAKRQAPESAGSLQIETPTFALTLVSVIVILTVLQFMPALVLGPIADHLSLGLH